MNNKNKNKKRAVEKAAPKKNSKTKKIVMKIIKWIILFGILLTVLIFFITSPIFNIKEIKVSGNEKISQEEIIYLSQVQEGENIYKYSKNKIKEKICQNPYIENVQVYRILPDKIEIEIKERKATFLMQLDGTYAYINNQGYILEKNTENIYLPIITGFTSKEEDITEGKQLLEEDLDKLQVVLNIMEIANSNQITELITKIDVSDTSNYTLYLETESKVVYLGTLSDMNMKISYLKGYLQSEKGVAGEIFLNEQYLKNDRAGFFREKIN